MLLEEIEEERHAIYVFTESMFRREQSRAEEIYISPVFLPSCRRYYMVCFIFSLSI